VSALARVLAGHPSSPLALKIGLWILVLGWGTCVAVDWFRDAVATPPPATARPRAPVDLDATIAQAAAAPLFGDAVEPEDVATALPAPIDIKLRGVFAGGGGPTAAIVNTGGEEDEVVVPGATLRPGVTLKSVHPTHIVVDQAGATRRIELEPLKSDAARSKLARHATGRQAEQDSPPESAAPETPAAYDAPAMPAEAASSTPAIPAAPMPQSRAAPVFPSGTV
jgi:general secretion pathway protein C